MYVCWYNRLSLHIDKVFSTIRFDSQSKISVGINVPKAFPEDRGRPISIAPGCITCPLDVWSIRRELRRNTALKASVRWLCRGSRHVVKLGLREPTDVGVGHNLAHFDDRRIGKIEQLIGS